MFITIVFVLPYSTTVQVKLIHGRINTSSKPSVTGIVNERYCNELSNVTWNRIDRLSPSELPKYLENRLGRKKERTN